MRKTLITLIALFAALPARPDEGMWLFNRPPRALLGFLKPYDQAIRDLALAVRTFVLQDMTPCYEYIYDAYNAVALGYGPTDRYQDGVCHIAVYAKHVNLGFNQGATLDDPKGVLQGTGKAVRHITIKTASDLEQPERLNRL